MNRINIQIPPRAWHKKDKRYYGVSGIFWKSDKISAVMVTYSIVQTKIDISEIDLEFPIGMQANGKEVYEGDVLVYDDAPEYTYYEIFWSDREYAFMGRDLEYENLVSLEEYDGFLCHYCNIRDTEKINRLQEEMCDHCGISKNADDMIDGYCSEECKFHDEAGAKKTN